MEDFKRESSGMMKAEDKKFYSLFLVRIICFCSIYVWWTFFLSFPAYEKYNKQRRQNTFVYEVKYFSFSMFSAFGIALVISNKCSDYVVPILQPKSFRFFIRYPLKISWIFLYYVVMTLIDIWLVLLFNALYKLY